MSNQNIFIISIIGIPFYGINKIETIKTIFKTLFDEVPCKISTPDQIQELILNTFNSFMSFDHFHREFKVIAGIVKVGQDTTELVSLGTGSKFLNDKLFEGNGNTLIDSHAEVLARRGFMRYLFYELRKSIQSPKSSIFIRDEANNNRFKLKKGISFHLYISTAPCGDGRVYSHCETNYRSPADIREGVLRYKGEESLTVLKDASKENDVKNPISMSCSAKIMKWNVLGLQGGLLAKYISPVYLTSIIIGNKFDKIHLERALYARIEHQLQSLPETYALHKPELLEVTQKASNPNNISNIAHSCNWFSPGKYGIEILNATNGKTENKQFSQLSKRALLHEFVNFGALLKENDIKTDYNSAKMSSNEKQKGVFWTLSRQVTSEPG
uniref:CSON014700 protein n=1 Tax=Culicoides sonorensis TaxID=179676 RepID=A0A336MNS5_CULSO